MSFTAKVKETGKIFEATDELGENGIRAWDAQTLARIIREGHYERRSVVPGGS